MPPRFTNRALVAEVVTAGSTAAAGAMTATFAAAPSLRNRIVGFVVTGSGASAASIIDVTITGLPTTLTFKLVIPAGVTTSITPLVVQFGDGILASADNTAITVSVPSFGAGNTHAAVAAWGYRD